MGDYFLHERFARDVPNVMVGQSLYCAKLAGKEATETAPPLHVWATEEIAPMSATTLEYVVGGRFDIHMPSFHPKMFLYAVAPLTKI